MSNTRYITKNGDRWDLIAYKAYGDATMIDIIIAANPGVPVDPVLKEGITLNIPIVDEPDVDKSLLPPWKR